MDFEIEFPANLEDLERQKPGYKLLVKVLYNKVVNRNEQWRGDFVKLGFWDLFDGDKKANFLAFQHFWDTKGRKQWTCFSLPAFHFALLKLEHEGKIEISEYSPKGTIRLL